MTVIFWRLSSWMTVVTEENALIWEIQKISSISTTVHSCQRYLIHLNDMIINISPRYFECNLSQIKNIDGYFLAYICVNSCNIRGKCTVLVATNKLFCLCFYGSSPYPFYAMPWWYEKYNVNIFWMMTLQALNSWWLFYNISKEYGFILLRNINELDILSSPRQVHVQGDIKPIWYLIAEAYHF